MARAVVIRRKVISTRSPTATEPGSASASWQRSRPPPSTSSTTATSGGLGVQLVDGERGDGGARVGHRDGAHLVHLPQDTHEREGGRWRVPHASHWLATRRYFHVSFRYDGGAAGGSGSGRRGGSLVSRPRQVR